MAAWATHVIPTLVLIIAIAVGWRWPLVGAIGFIGYSVGMVFSYAPEWAYVPLVSGPPLIIGVLYLIGWWLSRRAAIAQGAPISTRSNSTRSNAR